ncbi:C40 family peptidase [Oryzihumus sp.]|uniref:C40 family peptidase n=1 Tax=Oryzihumus sp. TaxID=1968903 RepID=UPI002EDBAC63
MSKHQAGRHRAQNRPTNPLGTTTGRTTAVLAVSGGIVATLAGPASAASSAAPAPLVAPPAAPDTVAVAAPAASPAVVAPTFGEVGFHSVAPKPAPAPKPVAAPAPAPVQRAATPQVSRATTRPAVSVSVASPATSVLAVAAQYAGVPYVWGGTTPSGFDCSGFTQYVFHKIGISLPRTAEEQRLAVTRVSTPQPGDLVFFGSPAYHVGIYAGGGMMWDEPHSGAVVSKRAIWTSAVTYGRP